jgi:hypothetical protein
MGLQTSRTENKASIILVDSHRSLFGARIVIEKDAMLSVESVAWMSNLKMSFSPILKDSMPLPVITLRNSHQNILWLSAPLKVTFLRVTSPTNLLWLGIFGNVTISTPSMTSSYQ